MGKLVVVVVFEAKATVENARCALRRVNLDVSS